MPNAQLYPHDKDNSVYFGFVKLTNNNFWSSGNQDCTNEGQEKSEIDYRILILQAIEPSATTRQTHLLIFSPSGLRSLVPRPQRLPYPTAPFTALTETSIRLSHFTRSLHILSL